MPIMVAAIAGGASLLGAGVSYMGAQDANDTNQSIANQNTATNIAEAQKTRDFQAEMSNTAYQRAVKDMQAAGLNPMLAYTQGGASTPSGATGYAQQAAPMQNKGAVAAQGISDAGSKPFQIQQMMAQTDQLKANSAQQITQAELNKAQAIKTLVDADLSVSNKNRADAETQAAQNLSILHAANTARAKQETAYSSAAQANISEQTKRAVYENVGAANEARVNESFYGKYMRPFIRDIVGASGAANSAAGAASRLSR